MSDVSEIVSESLDIVSLSPRDNFYPFARMSLVEAPSITRIHSPFRCERTEAIVAAIFAPPLKVGVMTDISGGFITNVQSLFR